MQLAATIRNLVHPFDSLREVLAKANSPKSGDNLAGISASSAIERVAARAVLSNLTLHTLRRNPAVPYEIDELTRMFEHSLDKTAFQAVAHLTVGQFREWLLENETDGEKIRSISAGQTPEMAAAVCKLMSNGVPVVARYARVWLEDEIGAAVGAKVAAILLGERPGLGTGDGLSAYMVYDPKIGNTDSNRNMMSNIHPRGTRPEVAGERLAVLARAMVDQKKSGVDLDLSHLGTELGDAARRAHRAPQVRVRLVELGS